MPGARDAAIEVIRRLPATATTSKILDELYFKEQIDRGLSDIIEGRTITHEELKARIAKCRKSSGR